MGRSRNSIWFVLLCILVSIGGVGGYSIAARFFSVPAPSQPVYGFMPTATANAAQLSSTSTHVAQFAATVQSLKDVALIRDPWVFSASESDTESHTINNTAKGLVLTVKLPDVKSWMISEQDLPSDVDVSVTAQGLPPDPCDGWSYSLDIRQQINEQEQTSVPFYDFEIYRDLIWRLGWYDGGRGGSRTIASGTLDSSFDIHQPNKVRVVAVGKHFDLFINDKQVGSADDPDATLYPKNRVGVALQTCSNPVSALFTNLVVTVPK